MDSIKSVIIVALFGSIILGVVVADAQVNKELPQFKSGASVMLGIPVDFKILDQRVGAIYDVVESNESHIVWKFTGSTGDCAFFFADGRTVVASAVDFDLSTKDTLTKELNDVMDMLNVVNTGITAEARNNALNSAIYYANESGIYHMIKYDFNSNFDFTLVVPDSKVKKARLYVEGVEKGHDYNVFGQYYYIDGEKVLSCENCCGTCFNCGGCTTGDKEVTDKILPGLHKLSAKASSQHTMIFEAITSSKPEKEFVLYGPNYKPWINESSRSMDLQALQEIIFNRI